MVCSECHGKPVEKPCGSCGKLPPVLEIQSEECPILFHTVEVEGNPTDNPPYIGQHKNALMVYKENGAKVLFSSDGIPSAISGTTEFNSILNRPKYGGVEMTSDTDIPDVTEAVAGEAALREAADNALEARIDTTDANLAAEVAARTNADAGLFSSIESLSSSLSSETEARQSADAGLGTRITDEAIARASADNTLQGEIDTLDTAIDTSVMTDLVVDPSTSTTVVQLDTTKKNLKTSVTTTDNVPLPVANATQAGVMNSATFQAVTDNTSNINALINGAVAITGLPASPTQQQLTDAWEQETGLSTLMNRAGVYDVTNQKVWTYYVNDTTWHAASNTTTVTINTFTNSAEGTIKGSTNIGQVFAENDGTGSVNGWDALKAQADNATSKLATIESGAQVNVQSDWTEADSTADDYIKNKPTVDSALSSTSTNAVENQAIDAEFDKVAYQGTTVATPSDIAIISTNNIQDGAVTEAKTDFILARGAVATGVVAIATGVNIVVPLTRPAANTNYVVMLTRSTGTQWPDLVPAIMSKTTTNFTIRVINNGTTGNASADIYYLAIA